MPTPHPAIRRIATVLVVTLFACPIPGQAAAPRATPRADSRPSAAVPSIAVVPAIDGDADEASRDAAAAVGDALRVVTGHHVVASEIAARVADYQQGGDAATDGAKAASDAIARAKEQYFNFRYREAQGELSKALLLLQALRSEPGVGQLFVDAYLSKALIAKSRGASAEARQALDEALAIHPALTLSNAEYPPSLVALFEEARSARASQPAGSLAVSSHPQGAEVFVNGIARGVAPLEIPQLPAGSYALALQANNYRPEERTVEVAPGRRAAVDVRMRWQKGDAKGAARAADDSAAAVREGLRVAEALKVEKVVLVDADAAGGEAVRVTARTVDRALRAGQRPVVVPKLLPADRHELLASLTAKIAEQIDADLLADPARTLDPVGEGDPVLLAKRKQKLTRRPLFWAIVGTLAAGAIVGGIAASMGGGSDVGNVKVTFK